MPITIQCRCGYRSGVADVLAGKTLKCPKCREAIVVPSASASPPGKKAARQREGPKFDLNLSPGKIILIVALITGMILGILFYVGPYHVWNQWEGMGSQANDTVTDVITFGLQSYLSELDRYDPREPHNTPAVEDGIQFFRPVLVMSMPDKVRFEGRSTQGPFKGYYNTKTGEVEADVAYGGYSLAGAVDINKATGHFEMTGRDVNGQPEAEANGHSLHIIMRPRNPDQ